MHARGPRLHVSGYCTCLHAIRPAGAAAEAASQMTPWILPQLLTHRPKRAADLQTGIHQVPVQPVLIKQPKVQSARFSLHRLCKLAPGIPT